jgi:shikimate kinase
MVESLIATPTAGTALGNRPRIVEIIGAAGAGKTTLYNALSRYPSHIRLSDFPNVRSLKDAPFFIRYGLQILPKLIGLPAHDSRPITRREFAWMTILKGWAGLLQRDIKNCPHTIVLDQGPVYLTVELKEFGPALLRTPTAEKLWQEHYCRWASTLDMIVWLDASNETLLERIRMREQDHIVKNESATRMVEFLENFRQAYERTVSVLIEKNPGLRILKFDTGEQETEEMVSQLMTGLGYS